MIKKERILEVAVIYFPFLKESNFQQMFKFNLAVTTKVMNFIDNSEKQNSSAKIRNFLILLFHLKNYLPIRTGCIIFNMVHSRYHSIINEELDLLYQFLHVIDINERIENNNVKEFENVFTCVDCTECIIEQQVRPFFSGKANHFTLKYQILVGTLTAQIVHIYGPERGSIHDMQLFRSSGLEDFFRENEEKVFADKGYIGSAVSITPLRKKRSRFSNELIPFSTSELASNKLISHYRIIVENVNASIKQWNIFSNVYRGDVENHSKIFSVCCILLNFSYY